MIAARESTYGPLALARLRRQLLASVAGISVIGAAGVVRAQSAAPPTVPNAQAETLGLEQVVVTARRRSENVERVPLSVTALSATQLAERSIGTQADLQAAVPGLVVRETQESNDLSFSIRGQGLDAESGSFPGVLPYIDDIQINTASASTFFDLSSIQVLKGPQGTLFGRNATGGAVLYQTTKPTNDFGGYAKVSAGNYGYAEAQGAINIPIVTDKVLLRVAGDVNYRDGYVKNIYDNSKLGTIEDQSVRASLTLRPTDKLQNTTVIEYDNNDGTNLAPELYSAYACGSTNGGRPLASTINCLFSPALDALLGVPGLWNAYLATHPKVPAGGLAAFVSQQQQLGLYKADVDNQSIHRSHNEFLANTTTYDLNPDFQLKNIFGASESVSRDNTDLDGSPYGVVEVRNAAGPTTSLKDTQQLSDEFQFLGKALDHKLDFIIGGYISFESDKEVLPTAVLDLAPIIPATGNVTAATLYDYSQAIYAQGTYDLASLTGLSGLKFTAGLRYTWEKDSIAQDPASIYYGLANESQDTSKPSWEVGLNYQITPELLTYVVTRGSFRSGGFNIVSPAVFATAGGGGNEFGPETTHDVEVGAKYQGHVFGVPARLNVAVYDQWVDNVQRAVYTIIPATGTVASVTVNVPSSEIKGFEFDTVVSPTPWLELGGNLAYTDAAYTNGLVNLFGASLPFGPYADAPRWSGDVFGQVHVTVPDGWGLPVFRADVYAQSKQFFTNLDNTVAPNTSIRGYALLNLRMDWHDFLEKKLTFSIFAKNVAGSKYYVGGIGLGAGLGINGVLPGAPAMYGAELSYKF